MANPPSKTKVAGTLGAGAAIAAAMALSVPQIKQHEGKRNVPYRDIVGVMTVCYGETGAAMRHYSDAECSAMLSRRVEHDFAAPVLACVPGFVSRPRPFGAAISLAYNIGTAAFCRSSAARLFNAGEWRAGCTAFLMWNKAGGRVVAGLLRRREAERQLCLSGAA